jgi:hypothetical protein
VYKPLSYHTVFAELHTFPHSSPGVYELNVCTPRVMLLSVGLVVYTVPHNQIPLHPQLSRIDNARWLKFSASFRTNVDCVQGRMYSAHILCRHPHAPMPALPDFGQSNGGTSIPVPPALLLNRPQAGSGAARTQHFPSVTDGPGSLYMLGYCHTVVGDSRYPNALKDLADLTENSQPTARLSHHQEMMTGCSIIAYCKKPCRIHIISVVPRFTGTVSQLGWIRPTNIKL